MSDKMRSSWKLSVGYIAALACLMCLSAALVEAQTNTSKDADNPVLRERIATIFRETIRQGERVVEQDGHQVRTLTFMPPSTEHVEEVRRYGKEAVPILAEYLRSKHGFEKYLAMRFLGTIGGSDVVEPLSSVASGDKSPSFRETALRWLTQTPWALASPIIRKAAKSDPSPEVRQTARELLIQYAPE